MQSLNPGKLRTQNVNQFTGKECHVSYNRRVPSGIMRAITCKGGSEPKILNGTQYIVAHLIGDYLLQNDWMAKGKKHSSWICLCHVIVYMIPFLATGLAWWQLSLIAAEHWIQDRTNALKRWMRFFGQNDFLKPPMAPWSIIVIDNTVHLAWIVFVVWLDKKL